MELATFVETARLVEPGGAQLEQVIEHRRDPLTGAVASINPALGEKARAFLGAPDLALLRELEEKTRLTCPFCRAAELGTRFAPERAAEGQLRAGRSLALPNLFSKAAWDAVVVIDPACHVLFPSRIPPEALTDAIRLAAEVVRRARTDDPALVHHAVGMNFLAPGGSSVPHPHLQVQARGVPYSGVARLLELGAEHHRRTGRSYWTALLEHERRQGARFIGETGRVAWLAAFAPSHQREIWGLLPGKASLAELDDADAADFAQGVARVISFYEAEGNHPFTLAFLSSPGPAAEHVLHVKLCARPALKALYANYDTWFAPKLLGDDVHTEAPERYAERLRARW